MPHLVLDEGKNPEEAREIAARAGLKSVQLERSEFSYINDRQ